MHTYVCENGKAEKATKHGRTAQESDDDGEEIAEQINKTEQFYRHSEDGVAKQYDGHAAEKENRGLCLSFLKEETHGAGRTYDQHDAREIEYISHREEALVEKKRYAEQRKGYTEGR